MVSQAVEQYNKALKLGQKNYKDCVLHNQYPYPQVLDDILVDSMIAGQIELGISEVPSKLIVGTKVRGRMSAFSANFMPLLDNGTEFSNKWIELCSSHLEEGIRDPIKCFEYLGRFYVQEGNKRVSVLKSMDSPTITCDVTRIIPVYSDDPVIRVYYEFMHFFQLSHFYGIWFQKPGSYRKLQAELGFEPDHVWTPEERRAFHSRFIRFSSLYEKISKESSVESVSAAMLVWLHFYSLDQIRDMSDTDLTKSIKAVLDDIRLQETPEPIQVNTAPADDGGKGLLSRILGLGKGRLRVAFINERFPEDSFWVKGHTIGIQSLSETMGQQVDVRIYNLQSPSDDAVSIMEKAVSEGAEVIFATTPPLITACRMIALKYPNVRILNCSVSMPYSGVRTYYSRIYEAKFITGAIAGAMSDCDSIGYVGSYPILGVPASINAFALGAQMTNPRARIQLHWSCTPGNYQDVLARKGVHIISNRDVPSLNQPIDDWGVYLLNGDGNLTPLASPYWNWGKFYEKVIRLILNGQWDAEASTTKQAVNYWWGMESDVVDIRLSDKLPDGVLHLARILRRGIRDGSIDPFHRPIVSQDGIVRNDGSKWFSPEEILNMDWLCSNVDGTIPGFDQILPMSQPMVRLLGIYRDQIQPEKGASVL